MNNDQQKSPCVYAIKSISTDRVYIGQTISLDNRLKQHNLGRVKSTKREVPWDVFAVEFLPDQAKARWVERNLKSSKSRRLTWIVKNQI